MSKEKTITAEEIKIKIFKGISEVFRGKTIYMKDIEEEVEQYAQAKVLEALEREVPKALSRGAYLAITKIDVVNTGIEPYIEDYIETEVKPKYE